MPGSAFFALFDDIASILDDVAAMTKIAAKKTAGVLGDDLALNAQQVAGVHADRELAVVWAVAKGSLVNKAILVPSALALSAFAPFLVTPVLMLGGTFLCYEGAEKLLHKALHPSSEDSAHHEAHLAALTHDDVASREGEKVKGAIRTDFILSAEIIVITLGTVAEAPFGQRVAVLGAVGLLMTVGVYGLVAAIVKLDDGGLRLSRAMGEGSWASAKRTLGRGILAAAPLLMRALSVLGTAAMFLVGGGILAHGFHPVEETIHQIAEAMAPASSVASQALSGIFGVLAGGLVLGCVTVGRRLLRRA